MINVNDAILRVPGVSQVDLYRRRRIRHAGLDPPGPTRQARAHARRRDRRDQGAEPAGAGGSDRRRAFGAGQEFTYTVRAPGRFTTPEEFENIIVRAPVTAARCGSRTSAARARYRELQVLRPSGRQAGRRAWPCILLPGANQVDAANGIYKTLEDLKQFFPQRRGLQDHLRHDAGRRGVDQGDRAHALRGDRPRRHRWCSSSSRTCAPR